MRLAIMQPYIFPYIGYFQLINAVEKFVIYDDVNFINKGWINRNNILINGRASLFTIPLKNASQNRLIKDISIVEDNKWKKKLSNTLHDCYKKAPYFDAVFPIIKSVFESETITINKLCIDSILCICKYLNISTEFINSSAIYKNDQLKGQSRILDICKAEYADHYINPVGGQGIYSKELFGQNNVMLNFIKDASLEYKQYDNEFIPSLSMIDVLMFNTRDEIEQMLRQYELL